MAGDGAATSNATINITVTESGRPVARAKNVTTPKDTSVAINLEATDPDGDPLTYALVDGPTHGTLTGTPPALTYVPAPGFTGSDSFSFNASDGTEVSDTVVIAITITQPATQSPPASFSSPSPVTTSSSAASSAPSAGTTNPVPATTPVPAQAGPAAASSTNLPPVARAGRATTTQGAAVSITLEASDPNGDPLTYTIATPPTNGTVSGIPPAVVYAPNPDFNGRDSFTFAVSDGSATSVPRPVSILVKPLNRPPTASGQTIATSEGQPIAIILRGNDPDGQPLTYAIGSGPANGTLSGTPPSVIYSPRPGYAGLDRFTFTVSDGFVTSDPATVTIAVDKINHRPIAMAQDLATPKNTPITIDLVASDSDGDGLTYTLVSAPTFGELSGTLPTLIYTPNPGFTGEDSFIFVAEDGTDTSNLGVISLTVGPVDGSDSDSKGFFGMLKRLIDKVKSFFARQAGPPEP